jgi:hypothetical protein
MPSNGLAVLTVANLGARAATVARYCSALRRQTRGCAAGRAPAGHANALDGSSSAPWGPAGALEPGPVGVEPVVLLGLEGAPPGADADGFPSPPPGPPGAPVVDPLFRGVEAGADPESPLPSISPEQAVATASATRIVAAG